MLRKHLSLLVASIVIPLGAVNAETFNLSLSVGGNATFFPEASKGFLVADTEGDGFEFLGSNSSYLLYGANASASGTLWGTNDVVVLAGLSTEVFPEVGRGFNASTVAFNSASLSQNWTSGDKFMLVWFPTGVSQGGSGYSYYRSEDKGNGTISFETPKQGASDDIVAVGISPTASGSITLASKEEFVVWLFEKIFLRSPGRDEFLANLARLQPTGNLTESGLAEEMLRSTAFSTQDKPVYAAHYWLGIAPSSRDSVTAAINLVQENPALLTGWQSFGNFTAAPFGGTFGMANATQFIFNNATLQSGNATVVSLSNPDFLDWFLKQVDQNGIATDQKSQLALLMSAHSPQTTRQGALVAFLSGYFTLQDPSINDEIIGAAARWLLNGRWELATNRPLSNAYLQLLLDPPALTIAVTPLNGGTVTGNGTHDVDTHAPISAVPALGYRFLGWTGNGVESPANATTTVLLDNDRQITANFDFKMVPSIAWATPSTITHGTVLGAGQLNAVANVAGNYTYTPTVGAVLATGNHTLSVLFTPTDSGNYTAVSGNVTVAVNKAATTILALPTASELTFGQTLANSNLEGGNGSVNGTFAFTTPNTVPPIGSSTHSVTFTPTDSGNYTAVSGNVTVAVKSGGGGASSGGGGGASSGGGGGASSGGGGGASSGGGGGAPPAKSKKGKGAQKSSASKAANSKSKSSSGGSAKKSGSESVKKSGGKKSKKK